MRSLSLLAFALCVLSFAVALAVALPARADPPDAGAAAAEPPTAATVAELKRRGDEARDARRWAEAAEAYRAAAEAANLAGLPASQRAMLFAELGMCEIEIGLPRNAASHLGWAMVMGPDLNPEQRARYLAALDLLGKDLSLVTISVLPFGARVYLDGEPLQPPELLYVVWMEPGRHAVHAKLDGHDDASQTFAVQPASRSHLALRLQASAAPGAGAAPITAAPPPALARQRAAARSSTGPRGDDAATSWRRAGAITAGSGAVVALGLGIAATAVQMAVEGKAGAIRVEGGPAGCRRPALRGACDDLHDSIATRDALAGAAVGTLIGSAAVGALTLSSLVWAPSRKERRTVRVLPLALVGQASLAVQARW